MSSHRRRRSQRLLFKSIDSDLRSVCDRLTKEDNYPSNGELNLFQRNIGEDGAEAVAFALQHQTTVKMLYMGWNGIGNVGVEALSQEALLQPSCSIAEVYLENNGIGAFGAGHLAQALKHNTSIQKLVLQGNVICPVGARSLADGLTHNHTLKELILASNIIGNDGAMEFGRALKHNTSLINLDLERNGIGAVGVICIAKTLERDNVTLTRLDLYGNEVGNEGAGAIKSMLHYNQSLVDLDLAVNRVDRTGALEIVQGLRHNTGLKRLDFYGNDIEFAGATALRRLLAQGENKTLESLIIGGFENSYWPEQRKIDYYCSRNKAGWRYIGNVTVPLSLWPRILQNISARPSLIYGFLQEKPDLFKQDKDVTQAQNVTRRSLKKRSHDEMARE